MRGDTKSPSYIKLQNRETTMEEMNPIEQLILTMANDKIVSTIEKFKSVDIITEHFTPIDHISKLDDFRLEMFDLETSVKLGSFAVLSISNLGTEIGVQSTTEGLAILPDRLMRLGARLNNGNDN